MNKIIEKEDLRVVFYGTPSFAVPTLEKLIDDKFNGMKKKRDKPLKTISLFF